MSIRELEVAQKSLEIQNLKARMLEIQQKLIDQTPGIIDAMVDIHKNLMMHEELIILMSDEDIALLHQAHEKHKQFTLVNKEIKKVGRSNSNLKNIKASDL